MDHTIPQYTNSQYYDGKICEELRIRQQQQFKDNIQLQTNSCYQIANLQRAEWDKAENTYTPCGEEYTNQLHYTSADGGLRRSKGARQAHNQTKSQHINGNTSQNLKIFLFVIILINTTLLLLTLSAIGLSAVTYKKLTKTQQVPEAIIGSLQLDSNNSQEVLLQEQLYQTERNTSQALAELDSTNNDIMLLQEQLGAIETNLTQVLLWLNAINNASHENAKQLSSLQLQLYCGVGEWHPLVHLNMSDPLSQCPPSWVEENVDGVRACGRGNTGGGCVSTMFNTEGQQYRKVCGRAIGYQYGNTDAFAVPNSPTINEVYVDGLSITYGVLRQHIWTYAAAVSEMPITNSYTASNCPCASIPGTSPPSFLGNNWYCESGNPNPINPIRMLSNDPLWDGENCEGTCCSNGKSPPWFSVELPAPTNDNIEARICANEHSDRDEDVLINIFEIYIQ